MPTPSKLHPKVATRIIIAFVAIVDVLIDLDQNKAKLISV
jgi:hypothetical protein